MIILLIHLFLKEINFFIIIIYINIIKHYSIIKLFINNTISNSFKINIIISLSLIIFIYIILIKKLSIKKMEFN